MSDPFIAHSEISNEIYIIYGKKKYPVTEQVISAMKATGRLNDRPKGEWIVGEYQDCHSDILPKYICPFCGEVVYRKYDFCHCGADMRGGKE